MRYKKKGVVSRQTRTESCTASLGMLYIASVRLIHAVTGEVIKHRLLLVGCELDDIERKLRWIFDPATYRIIALENAEKVREKVHFLSTTITRQGEPSGPVINRESGSQVVPQQKTTIEAYDPHLYAIGVTTTMLAKDEEHALRKLGHALVSHCTEGRSHSGASLSDDSTVTVEEIPKSNGYAQARDVSRESNRAHMVRG